MRLRAVLYSVAILWAGVAQAGDLTQDPNFMTVSLQKESFQAAPAYPPLFGKDETRHDDMKPFTKWAGVLKRFGEQFQSTHVTPKTKAWLSFLQKQRDTKPLNQIKAINRYMNKQPFIEDKDNYKLSDYWATPMEFLKRGGDCEDYAIAKYVSLRALGFAEDTLRLAIVYDTDLQLPHAVLIVYLDGKPLVLDNQTNNVKSADALKHYMPIYSINQLAWWRH